MCLGNVVDKFHNKHSFSYTSTPKKPNLSTSLVWCKKVNDLQNESNIINMDKENIYLIRKLMSVNSTISILSRCKNKIQ